MANNWQVSAQIGNHKLIIDQEAAGDAGPNPLDTFLFSLAGCVSTIAKMVAREQGFVLNGINVEVEGTINPAGLAGRPSEDPVGFKHIDIKADINADLNDQQKLAFLELVCKRCPAHDNLCRASLLDHQLS
ncbi:OsmC family protein [Oceanisphaera sp. DM8]|uniref:OsmC family protein n=2 Tax=Oceanisphaera pacifica TaxID=2818389 RepID=A0ABS3NHU0_9GAMM|nr:OsmC family protein [Oceanisphaera pacifica]